MMGYLLLLVSTASGFACWFLYRRARLMEGVAKRFADRHEASQERFRELAERVHRSQVVWRDFLLEHGYTADSAPHELALWYQESSAIEHEITLEIDRGNS